MMGKKALLVNYRYCTGCHACEMACKAEHGLAAEQYGIRVFQSGPFRIDDRRWNYDFIPVPTDLCDLCSERAIAGKEPTCVVHCQSFAITAGSCDQLAVAAAEDGKKALFSFD